MGLGARGESASKQVTQGRLGYPRKKKIYRFVVPNAFGLRAYLGVVDRGGNGRFYPTVG